MAAAVLRDQFLRRERGQENIHFPCSANYEQVGNRLIYTLLYKVWDDYTCSTYIALHAIHTYKQGWRYCLGQRVRSCMMCVVNFILPLSQLQGVEWGWPGRREPDCEHYYSPAS